MRREILVVIFWWCAPRPVRFLMIYPIVRYGQPVLEKKAAAITEFDTPELNMLVDDMFESMYAAKGVGLAAPQIGIGKRIAVIDIASGEDPAQKLVLINPEIIDWQGSQGMTGEGAGFSTFIFAFRSRARKK